MIREPTTRRNKFLSTLSLRRATPHSAPDNSRIRFLSTLSLRRATSSRIKSSSITIYFYPRSPCGERHIMCSGYIASSLFLSTLSLRRATWWAVLTPMEVMISIHALLAESDLQERFKPCRSTHFYPRSPCGERHFSHIQADNPLLFLSTLSLRRATNQPTAYLQT